MAHEIDFSTGEAGFVEFGDRVTAWHGHGRAVPTRLLEGASGEEQVQLILENARLDWEVQERDILLRSVRPDSPDPFIKDWRAYVRSDTQRVLTVAPESYTILQNEALFKLVEPMLDAGIMLPETAGSLRDGEDVWGLFRFKAKDPVVQEYFAEEGIIPYALLANNHSRKRVVTLMETPVRVVCANTLGMAAGALQRGKAGRYPGAVTLRHTRNVRSASVDAVQELWGQITERYAAVANSYQALKARYLQQEEFEAHVLDALAPLPEDTDAPRYESTRERAEGRRNVVQTLWEGEGRGITGDGSAWEAYNATAEALDHYPDVFPTRTDRLQGIFPGGSLANKKQDVLNNLHALAEA